MLSNLNGLAALCRNFSDCRVAHKDWRDEPSAQPMRVFFLSEERFCLARFACAFAWKSGILGLLTANGKGRKPMHVEQS